MKRTNRSSLFADVPNGYQEQQMQYQELSESHLDANVNEKVQLLRNSMSDTRHIAIAIGDEIRRSNNELEEMNVLIDDTETTIRKMTRKLKKVIGTGGAKYMCWLILFVFFVFFILYWMIKTKI